MASELKDFLTQRRRQIPPETLGRPSREGRRSPGLSRADMAHLSDVSFKWYTLFESGAAKGVSRKLAERVAEVLRLSPAERQYLLGLLGFVDHGTPSAHLQVPAALNRMLHDSDAVALALHSPLFDVIDANRRYRSLFPPAQAASTYRDNKLWRLFMDPGYRAAWVDWERMARRALADFRTMTARMVHSGQYAALMLSLRASEEFTRLWEDDRPLAPGESGARFDLMTPAATLTSVELVMLESTEAPGLYFTALLTA
ncbi:hypothetical protein BH11PSE9_BH11PSE9_09110 [soil metagenome]